MGFVAALLNPTYGTSGNAPAAPLLCSPSPMVVTLGGIVGLRRCAPQPNLRSGAVGWVERSEAQHTELGKHARRAIVLLAVAYGRDVGGIVGLRRCAPQPNLPRVVGWVERSEAQHTEHRKHARRAIVCSPSPMVVTLGEHVGLRRCAPRPNLPRVVGWVERSEAQRAWCQATDSSRHRSFRSPEDHLRLGTLSLCSPHLRFPARGRHRVAPPGCRRLPGRG